MPFGYVYGLPNDAYIAAIAATDFSEAKEFLFSVPWDAVCIALLTVFLFFLYCFLWRKYAVRLYRNRLLLVLLSMAGLYQYTFLYHLFDSTQSAVSELVKLARIKSEVSQWHGLSANPTQQRYDDYVLVIGESARRDYHHVYGYPVENTPFLDTVNGVVVDGLRAADTTTIPSLSRMLTHVSDSRTPDFSLIFVDMAKKVGMETVWISNQGYLGLYDTPVSAIASRADQQYFLKQGGHNSKNTSDYELIPLFEKALSGNGHKKRLLVLHLYGSHPYACDRVTFYPKEFQAADTQYREMACYLASIRKTDEFLQKIYGILQENHRKHGRQFSLVYFADHGLTTEKVGDKWRIFHPELKGKQHYNVPLVLINSDSDRHQVVHSDKSGFYFTDGLAKWLGITGAQLRDYDLFDGKNDSDAASEYASILNPLKDDPPLVFEGKWVDTGRH